MTDTTPLRLTIIIGSTRNGRFCPKAADWFAGHARARDDLDVSVVDLAESRLPEVLDFEGEQPRAVADLTPLIDEADAFVVVTPEYNHSYPAALKNAIDWFGDEWRAKPLGYVSYGGISGGLRSVEALRLVFDELHVTSMRTSVAFLNYWELFDESGVLTEPRRHEGAATAMLDELVWWGDALRRQRERRPYPRTGDEEG